IATLEQLEGNLTPEILEPFRSGKLAKWLRVRKLDEQAEAVEALLAGDNEREMQLLKSLYGLFGGETDNDLLQVAIAERKRSLPLSQESYDMELEAVQTVFKKEIEQLKMEFTKKEREYQQEIEQLRNPPKPRVIETHIQQFIAYDDGTALDTKTGLTWCRFAHGQTWQNGTVSGDSIKVDWDSAFEVAKLFNRQGGYAGHTDWRLPTIAELVTLINESNHYGINTAVFINTYNYFWSSSKYDSYYAWCLNFSYGKHDWLGKSNNYAVRLVRG
ncbi:MAG: DUF1566 domain-containing protein, partial [Methylococcales bacterium]|nr:DUF1566 domain-containing protein [Methylococcales bacterium]